MSEEIAKVATGAAIRFQQGDVRAFDELVHIYYNRVYFVAYSWINQTAAAEDITQEVFIAAFVGIGTLRNPHSVGSWLFSLTRNICKNRLRRNRIESDFLQRISEEAGMDNLFREHKNPRDFATETESKNQLRQAVARLEPELREVLLLHYGEDMTQSEIARHLGVAPYAIHRKLEKAYALLKDITQSNSLKSLAVLKPSDKSLAGLLSVIGSISILSNTSHAKILESFSQEYGTDLFSDAVAEIEELSNVDSPSQQCLPENLLTTASEKSGFFAFLSFGTGKILSVLAFAGALLLGSFYYHDNNETPTILDSSFTGQEFAPATGRRTGAGKTKLGGEQDVSVSTTSPKKSGAGTMNLEKYAVLNDDNLTQPMVQIYGKIELLSKDGRPVTSTTVSICQNGSTLRGELNHNVVLASQRLESSGQYDFIVPDGTGLYLKIEGTQKHYRAVETERPDQIRTINTLRKKQIDIHITEIPKQKINGKVIWDDTSAPVTNAVVTTEKNPIWLDGDFTYTDANGNFSLETRPFIKSIAAGASEAAPQIVQLDQNNNHDIIIKLKKALPGLHAEIININTRLPVPNAKIFLKENLEQQYYLQFPYTVTADELGHFTLPSLTSGTVDLMIIDSNGNPFYPTDNNVFWRIKKDANETTSILIKGFSTIDISGNVVDENDMPISGAKVFPVNMNLSPQAVTDNNGNFTLLGIPELYDQMNTYIAIEKNGYVLESENNSSWDGPSPTSFNNVLYPKTYNLHRKFFQNGLVISAVKVPFENFFTHNKPISFKLVKSKPLKGIVLGKNNSPLEGANILARGVKGNYSSITNSKGEFQLDLPNNISALFIEAPGYTTKILKDLKSDFLTVNLASELILYGDIQDSFNIPDGIEVRLYRVTAEGRSEVRYPIDYELKRKATNTYYFDKLESGNYQIEFGRGMTLLSETLNISNKNSPLKKDLFIETHKPRNVKIYFQDEQGEKILPPVKYKNGNMELGSPPNSPNLDHIQAFFTKVPSNFSFYNYDLIYYPVVVSNPPSGGEILTVTLKKKTNLISIIITYKGQPVKLSNNIVSINDGKQQINYLDSNNGINGKIGSLTVSKNDDISIRIDHSNYKIPMDKLKDGDTYELMSNTR